MISKRSFRRKVSEEKRVVYGEIRENFNKFSTICRNANPEGTDLERNEENESCSIEKNPNVKSMTNLMCLINELTISATSFLRKIQMEYNYKK